MSITGVRVVIDTNVLIPIISKRSPSRWIFNAIISGRINICVTTEILMEYREILEYKTNAAVAENILDFIASSPFVEKYEVFYKFNLIEQDSSDNKFVDCAIVSNAEL